MRLHSSTFYLTSSLKGLKTIAWYFAATTTRPVESWILPGMFCNTRITQTTYLKKT